MNTSFRLAERKLDVAFIVVSHHIGESAAVIAMQRGAADYLPKGDLGRLPKAIASAIERRDARREKQRALDALRRSESMRRGILDSLLSRLALVDGTGTILTVNRAWEDFDTARTSMGIAIPGPGTNYLDALQEMPGRGNGFAPRSPICASGAENSNGDDDRGVAKNRALTEGFFRTPEWPDLRGSSLGERVACDRLECAWS